MPAISARASTCYRVVDNWAKLARTAEPLTDVALGSLVDSKDRIYRLQSRLPSDGGVRSRRQLACGAGAKGCSPARMGLHIDADDNLPAPMTPTTPLRQVHH